jgi:hypothetical protein
MSSPGERDALKPLEQPAPVEESSQSGAMSDTSLIPLVKAGALIEAFLLALIAVAPVGGVSQSISPLARSWPVLLVPARLVFGDALVNGSVPAAREWPALALFTALLVGAACASGSAVLAARSMVTATRDHLRLILGGALVLGVTMLLLPSLPSDDVFSYILYGRISAVHHANPLVIAPASFPSDPFLSLVFWRGVRSVYGPVWLLFSGGLTHIAQAFGGSLTAYVLLFKLLGLAAHLANVALIWAILGRLAPRWRVFGTALYAWNPLCLLEFCASAHNDALMLTFALAAVYLLLRGQEVAALVMMGLSISTKYVLLVLLPLYLLLVIRRQLAQSETVGRISWAIAWRVGVVLGVVGLTALPYWDGAHTFSSILYSPPAQQLDNSPLEALSYPLRALLQVVGVGHARAGKLAENWLKLLGLLAFALVWLRLLARVRDLESMLAGWAWALFAYVVIASGWFWPWYVTWVVAFVALLPWSDLTVATLLLAGGSLILYGFQPLYDAPVYGLRAYLAFGPAVGYLLWRWRRDGQFSPSSGAR